MKTLQKKVKCPLCEWEYESECPLVKDIEDLLLNVMKERCIKALGEHVYNNHIRKEYK